MCTRSIVPFRCEIIPWEAPASARIQKTRHVYLTHAELIVSPKDQLYTVAFISAANALFPGNQKASCHHQNMALGVCRNVHNGTFKQTQRTFTLLFFRDCASNNLEQWHLRTCSPHSVAAVPIPQRHRGLGIWGHSTRSCCMGKGNGAQRSEDTFGPIGAR